MINKMVKCVKTNGHKYLTIGYCYEITNESDDTLVIINDIDIKCNYSKKMFEEIVDIK